MPSGPPALLPDMWQARKEKTKGAIPQTAWPCVHCDASGCEECGNTGEGSRAAFAAWYNKLIGIRKRALVRYQDVLDDDAQQIVGPDFYDLEKMRKVSPR